jgi:hypothetical protein
MFKKKQKDAKSEDLKIGDCNDDLEPHKHPMVFLFDFAEEVEQELKRLRINRYAGSFGALIKVENKRYDEKFLKLNYDYPSNLHEFDIIMLDLTAKKLENYDPIQHQFGNISGNTAHALLSTYPEQVFDPRPLSISFVARDIEELFEKESIVIAFCGAESNAEYQFLEITDRGEKVTGTKTISNYCFYKRFPGYKARHGVKVKLPRKELKLSALFSKYLDKTSYHTVFHHPTVWKDGKYIKNEDFIPLLFNERNEIVSYAHVVKKTFFLVLPDIDDKASFISELFKTYLPEINPKIFPFHGEFKWLYSGDYPLPGEKSLLQKKAEIEERYNKDLLDNEEALVILKEKYKFLSDLISETGDTLVNAVETFLKWLDFDSVVNLDDTGPDLLEEDIQVDCGDRFLVVEIKGLGGTSTDKDCSQVSKIRYRRAEQRGKFDVYGLYIVNHQRYLPPKSRSNPPFTITQIKDAELDTRGLLTTYELYNAYFYIKKGILTKREVREALFKTGLICLEPEGLVRIGIANELFMNGQVVILNIDAVNISVGDTLLIKQQGQYFKAAIESIQLQDEDVQNCKEGEVGIKLNKSLKKNAEIFIRQG